MHLPPILPAQRARIVKKSSYLTRKNNDEQFAENQKSDRLIPVASAATLNTCN
jgi:hypothetical protein